MNNYVLIPTCNFTQSQRHLPTHLIETTNHTMDRTMNQWQQPTTFLPSSSESPPYLSLHLPLRARRSHPTPNHHPRHPIDLPPRLLEGRDSER